MKSKPTPGRRPLQTPAMAPVQMEADSWIDGKDFREQLQISARTLRRWCQLGLVYSKIGGRCYFRGSEVHQFFLLHEQRPTKRKSR